MGSPHAARFSLAGRRALVTGAGRGLGLAIARALAEAGAAVALNGRDADRVEAAAKALLAEGLAAEPAPFDVTDHAAAGAWFAAAEPPDILVNNATLRDRRPTGALGRAVTKAHIRTLRPPSTTRTAPVT